MALLLCKCKVDKEHQFEDPGREVSWSKAVCWTFKHKIEKGLTKEGGTHAMVLDQGRRNTCHGARPRKEEHMPWC